MNKINIHERVKERLDKFISRNNIPHIIFHGPSGSGKRTILNEFINKIYNNDDKKKRNSRCLWIAHMGKG